MSFEKLGKNKTMQRLDMLVSSKAPQQDQCATCHTQHNKRSWPDIDHANLGSIGQKVGGLKLDLGFDIQDLGMVPNSCNEVCCR